LFPKKNGGNEKIQTTPPRNYNPNKRAKVINTESIAIKTKPARKSLYRKALIIKLHFVARYVYGKATELT